MTSQRDEFIYLPTIRQHELTEITGGGGDTERRGEEEERGDKERRGGRVEERGSRAASLQGRGDC